MLEAISPSSLLVLGAVSTYVLGFLLRDQIALRGLVTVGSSLYATYYWTAGPEPLWDAIAGSALIGIASLQGMVRLTWSRLPLAVPRGTEHILRRMGDIEPGLFRQFMKAGKRMTANAPSILTQQDAPPDALWFVISGSVTLKRQGHAAMAISDGCFIGEIAWLRAGNASATVTVSPGAELVCWSHRDLHRLLKRNQRLDIALQALIAQNLANKLSTSFPSTQVRENIAV